jgi:hypothetical protein
MEQTYIENEVTQGKHNQNIALYLLLYLLFKERQGMLVNDFMYEYSN